ncbi:uncharacterized protein LTR77_002571 [Saxophila tyrrhenica]|uniref:DUF3074 domain-containing protein n=1 Tax=Saxophila tyrrhenica TaxID=1690608 RepID=A0AAV9PM22_9PEZI|nr:hypothetical protein LTR77_002571 [Saxophila tyrrhenica]
MADLHEALKKLSPTTWTSTPHDNNGELPTYLTDIFTAAELLVNSVPPPPNGNSFATAQPQFTTPNSAKSSKDVHSSSARPAPPDAAHAALQKQWGKPMKYSQKDNPLNVALYKTAGHDRHGAWFARHQVMEGISFGKFEKALKREFPETLLVQGQPGAGAKRGLSADRRVERIDADVDGVGRMEVYQLSAQMPPPVSPRDFLTLLLSTDKGLTEKSGAELDSGKKHVPRSYMVVSRPLDHPDAPPRSSFVRGQYESVELIREIPLHVSKSTADLSKDGEVDPELNPVEWIMITRSDPAGGVPRFLVDRGTPGAMLTDVTKFLDWACAYEQVPDQDEDLELQLTNSAKMTEEMYAQQTGVAAGERTAAKPTEAPTPQVQEPAPQPSEETPRETPTPAVDGAPQPAPQPTEPGMLSNVMQSVGAGATSYAPAPVASFVNRQLGTDTPSQDLSDDDTSSTSSVDSFLSAREMRRLSTAPEAPPRASTENLSMRSVTSSTSLSNRDKKSMTPYEKDLHRLTQQREKLDQKLAKKREAEEEKLKSSAQKEQSEQDKARERMEREMRKTEDRHRKEIEKLEAKRSRRAQKAEERKKKREEGDKMSLVARERDEARGQRDFLKRENELLREQVEGLQRENNALAGRGECWQE